MSTARRTSNALSPAVRDSVRLLDRPTIHGTIPAPSEPSAIIGCATFGGTSRDSRRHRHRKRRREAEAADDGDGEDEGDVGTASRLAMAMPTITRPANTAKSSTRRANAGGGTMPAAGAPPSNAGGAVSQRIDDEPVARRDSVIAHAEGNGRSPATGIRNTARYVRRRQFQGQAARRA